MSDADKASVEASIRALAIAAELTRTVSLGMLLERGEANERGYVAKFREPADDASCQWIEFGAKVLNGAKLLEHNTDIGFARLTASGKLLLRFLREFGTMEDPARIMARRWGDPGIHVVGFCGGQVRQSVSPRPIAHHHVYPETTNVLVPAPGRGHPDISREEINRLGPIPAITVRVHVPMTEYDANGIDVHALQPRRFFRYQRTTARGERLYVEE